MRLLGQGHFIVPLTYFIVFWSVVWIIGPDFDPGSFLQWDAEHYRTIAENGYEGFRTAFFPLFPMIWAISELNALGVSILNGCIFFLCIIFFAREFQATPKELFLTLSFPGMVYMFIPYTEANFFLGSTLLLIALHRSNSFLSVLGGIICGLSRPASLILIPALALPLFFPVKKGLYRPAIFGVLSLLLGVFITSGIQYADTGEWFSFFSAQSNWDNSFRTPSFPFTSWAGANIVRLDGAALLTGTISGILFLLRSFRVKKSNTGHEFVLRFALAYIAGISLMVVLFRGGSLFSLNRFVFGTAFFMLMVPLFYRSRTWGTKDLSIAFFGLSLFFLAFFSWVHIQVFLKYELLAAYICLIPATRHPNQLVANSSFFLVMWGNLSIQVWMMSRYLEGMWIG